MVEYVTAEELSRATGRSISSFAMPLLTEQIADTIQQATDWPEFPFLKEATWLFKGISRSVNGRTAAEFNTLRFESQTDPLIAVVVDITDGFLFEAD